MRAGIELTGPELRQAFDPLRIPTQPFVALSRKGLVAVDPVLVDSSFYIQKLLSGHNPLQALALAGATRDLSVCGAVRCEVGTELRQRRLWVSRTYQDLGGHDPGDFRTTG